MRALFLALFVAHAAAATPQTVILCNSCDANKGVVSCTGQALARNIFENGTDTRACLALSGSGALGDYFSMKAAEVSGKWVLAGINNTQCIPGPGNANVKEILPLGEACPVNECCLAPSLVENENRNYIAFVTAPGTDPSTTPANGDQPPHLGVIIGAVVGSLAGVALIVVIIVLVVRRRRGQYTTL